MTHTTEQERADFIAWVRTHEECHGAIDESSAWVAWQAARRAPAVPETIEQRAKKLKGLQVLIGATAGVPEAIELARSRFTEAYGRSPLHDDLAYACLLIDAYGGAPAAPVPADPMDWQLPCDVTVGHGTMHKGVKLRTLILRMKSLYKMATGNDADEVESRTVGERQNLLDDFVAQIAAAPQPPEAGQSNSAEFEGIKPDAFQTEGGLKSEIRTTKDHAFWRACDLLSMTIGTLMGFRQKLGYTDKSPIAGLVNDAVKFLEPWPEKLPTATKPPEADGRKTVSILSGKEDVFAIDILGGPMREYATGKWENAAWPSEAAPMQMPEPVAHLWQHGETGRTRVVMPDAITDCDGQWKLVGALYIEQQVRQILAAQERAHNIG